MHYDPLELALSHGADFLVAVELRNLLQTDKTGWQQTWVERLNDREFVSRYPGEVKDYLDPIELKRLLDALERLSNPFDPERLQFERWCQMVDAGGEMTMSRIDNGEEVARWRSPGSPQGGAWSN